MYSFFDKKPMVDDEAMQKLAMVAGAGVNSQPQSVTPPKSDTELAADVQKKAINDQRAASSANQLKTEQAKTQIQTNADLKKEEQKNIWERTKDEVKDMTLFDLIPIVAGALAGGVALGPVGAMIGAGAGQVKGRQIKTQEKTAKMTDPRFALDAWYKEQMVGLDRAAEGRAQEDARRQKFWDDFMKNQVGIDGGQTTPPVVTPQQPPTLIPTVKI